MIHIVSRWHLGTIFIYILAEGSYIKVKTSGLCNQTRCSSSVRIAWYQGDPCKNVPKHYYGHDRMFHSTVRMNVI